MSELVVRLAASSSRSSSTDASSSGTRGSTSSRSSPASSAKHATSEPNSPGCHSGWRAVQRQTPGTISVGCATLAPPRSVRVEPVGLAQGFRGASRVRLLAELGEDEPRLRALRLAADDLLIEPARGVEAVRADLERCGDGQQLRAVAQPV